MRRAPSYFSPETLFKRRSDRERSLEDCEVAKRIPRSRSQNKVTEESACTCMPLSMSKSETSRLIHTLSCEHYQTLRSFVLRNLKVLGK